MKRHLVIGLVAVLLVIAVPIVCAWLIVRPIPALSGAETVPGLDQSVSVAFDNHAIPYIEARTDTDAFIAQGYVTARDRMFQMDMLRRSAYGQMSEAFGASWLPTDRLMRTLGIRKLAEAELDKLSPAAKSTVEAYARGVNEYIDSNRGALPLQFDLFGYKPRTWHAADSLAILKYQAYRSDESWRLDDFRQRVFNRVGADVAAQLFRDDLLAFGLPKSPEENDTDSQKEQHSPRPAPAGETPRATNTPAVTGLLTALAASAEESHANLRTTPLMGSTSWAVPARATTTGGSMLACNTDGAFTSPSDWYICSLNSPGMHAAGATMPGVPCVMHGRNENVAWGSSALKADVQDIFLEDFKSQFDISYRIPEGGWKEAELTTELIPVRFGKDVEHKVFTTAHGPVLIRSDRAGVSLSWTGFKTDKPSFEALYRVNRAASTDELVQSLSFYNDPPAMFVFADRWGNIGCQAAGAVPTRGGGGTGTMLNPGWEAKGTWTGAVPFDKLPRGIVEYSTSNGAKRTPVIAANQRPSADTNTIPHADGALSLGHQWAPPYRANRLLAVLASMTNGVSLADMANLAGDQYSELAPVIATELDKAKTSTKLIDANSLIAIDLLTHWDGHLRPEGPEASIYESYMQTLARRIVEPKLGRDLATEYLRRWPLWTTFVQSVIQNQPVEWLSPEERTYETFFLTTLTQSLKALHITFDNNKPTNWMWGKVHQAVFPPVGGGSGWLAPYYRVGPVSVGGAPECINSCDVSFDPSAVRYVATSGPTQRMIVDMADRSKFYQSVCTGESGHLTSKYRDDQLKAWSSADLLPIAFSPDQLLKQTTSRLTLDPH